MGRFIVFAGNTYYPRGGWEDFVGDYDTLGEAQDEARRAGGDDRMWWHIVDLHEKAIVEDD